MTVGAAQEVAHQRAALTRAVVHAMRRTDVRASGLDWTIVHPSGLTDKPATGRWQTLCTDQERTLRGTITRADLAACMLACLTDDDTVGRALGASAR